MKTPNEEGPELRLSSGVFTDRNSFRVRGVTARVERVTIARSPRGFEPYRTEALCTTPAALDLQYSTNVQGRGGCSVSRPASEPPGAAGPEDTWSMRVTKATVVRSRLMSAGPVGAAQAQDEVFRNVVTPSGFPAAGPKPASIRSTVDPYRNALGRRVNVNAAGPPLGSRDQLGRSRLDRNRDGAHTHSWASPSRMGESPRVRSSPTTGLGADDTARRDIVMMDDFLHGEPQAIE
jgi:hypothetical protein